MEIIYANYRKADGEGTRVSLWGGKCLENICQATCRDFLTGIMVSAHERRYRIPMHTHDEIILEVPEHVAKEAQAWLDAAMSTPPAWAEGFPIKGESQIMRRYGK
jgi:DNA polymerase